MSIDIARRHVQQKKYTATVHTLRARHSLQQSFAIVMFAVHHTKKFPNLYLTSALSLFWKSNEREPVEGGEEGKKTGSGGRGGREKDR